MFYYVWPETDRGFARFEVGAHELEHGTNGPFGYPVELMHVRWAACVLHGLICEELLELPRQKLACVVRVQRANDACRLATPLVRDRFEFGDGAGRVTVRNLL